MTQYSNAQLSIILQTLTSENKPAKIRSLVKKAKKRCEKEQATYDTILTLFRTKPDSGLVKPKNAWQLFLAEFRKGLDGDLAGSEQTKRASTAWKALNSAEKQPYIDEAANQSAKYKLQKEEINGPKLVRGRGRPRKDMSIDLSDPGESEDEEDREEFELAIAPLVEVQEVVSPKHNPIKHKPDVSGDGKKKRFYERRD